MPHRVFVINPGSTSTKIALYEEEAQLFLRVVDHNAEEISRYNSVLDQLDMRRTLVEQIIKEERVDLQALSACIAIGGLLPGVEAGGYLVDEAVLHACCTALTTSHAANLAAVLAHEIASPLGIPAYIYDCITADEMDPIAKITGLPDYRRQSRCHMLNQRAVGRKVAKEQGRRYEEMKTLIAHLGGGISIGVHKYGRVVDCIGEDSGPFSPERSGGLPLLHVIHMCYEGKYTYREMVGKVRGMGGIKAHLGTADLRKVEKMIEEGNRLAEEVYEAQAYQIAKGIGEMAPVLDCEPDCIILTGGMAHSERMTALITKRVQKIAPVVLSPGENEMEALNLGALRMLRGEETPKTYVQIREEEA